jgi:hypothetical protein
MDRFCEQEKSFFELSALWAVGCGLWALALTHTAHTGLTPSLTHSLMTHHSSHSTPHTTHHHISYTTTHITHHTTHYTLLPCHTVTHCVSK